MLLRMADWERIREQFSEEEKGKLNEAITGETICPRGCVVDEAQLGDGLTNKVRMLVGVARQR